MAYILYIPFALLPSIIWLLFYLKKDRHPESKKMILKIFFYGMLAAVVAASAELGITFVIGFFSLFLPETTGIFSVVFFILYNFIVIALVEEVAKFLIVQEKVMEDSEFDEPPDAMIYMIVTALGFAALENFLYLSPLLFGSTSIEGAATIAGFRFIGATFLHALASGVIGFFLALSLFEPKRKKILLATGIIIAVILHGLFNLSIMGIGEGVEAKSTLLTTASIGFLIIILSSLAIFVGFGFKKLKKIASVCKLK